MVWRNFHCEKKQLLQHHFYVVAAIFFLLFSLTASNCGRSESSVLKQRLYINCNRKHFMKKKSHHHILPFRIESTHISNASHNLKCNWKTFHGITLISSTHFYRLPRRWLYIAVAPCVCAGAMCVVCACAGYAFRIHKNYHHI